MSKLAACDQETNIEQADGKCPHLLKLLLSGEVEDETDDEGDAHDEEQDGADDVDHQVQSEVAHFGDLEQMLFVRLSLKVTDNQDFMNVNISLESLTSISHCCQPAFLGG